jgi:AraC-like DNA-binding protein
MLFAVIMLAGLPIYLKSGAAKIEFYHLLQQGVRPPLVRITDILKYGSGISYTAVTILFLRTHRTRVKDSYSSIERVNLRWLLHLAAGAAVTWAAAALFYFTEVAAHPLLERPDDVVALATAILVYGIGYMALRQPEVFNIATGEFPTVTGLAPAVPGTTTNQRAAIVTTPEVEASRRYERSGLSESEAAALKDALVHAMDKDRPYRNSELTLPDLAGQLGTTPHRLSEVLNSQLNQSFYDFVNGYRVSEVQRRLADDRSQALTLLSLALDAGFASKSTFNSVFKKHTGQTPSGYRRSLESEKGSAAPDG